MWVGITPVVVSPSLGFSAVLTSCLSWVSGAVVLLASSSGKTATWLAVCHSGRPRLYDQESSPSRVVRICFHTSSSTSLTYLFFKCGDSCFRDCGCFVCRHSCCWSYFLLRDCRAACTLQINSSLRWTRYVIQQTLAKTLLWLFGSRAWHHGPLDETETGLREACKDGS